jgi:hypothetical protein
LKTKTFRFAVSRNRQNTAELRLAAVIPKLIMSADHQQHNNKRGRKHATFDEERAFSLPKRAQWIHGSLRRNLRQAFSMTEHGEKSRQVIEKIVGASRHRFEPD